MGTVKQEIMPLSLPQRLQLLKSMRQVENSHFLTTICCGHSDFGGSGIRTAWQMGKIRRLLLRRKNRFESVSLLGLSDEALQLYAAGFDCGLAPIDIWPALAIYEDEIRRIGNQPWGPWRKKYEVLSVYLWARAYLRLTRPTRLEDENKVGASL